MEKICAIVVTYNRKKELEENIKSLLDQTLAFDILVIDNNSTDGTKELVFKYKKVYKNILYTKLDKNIGGAGGFYSGLKEAYEKNYDYYILMDDDGRPRNNKTFENLFDAYKSENNKMLILNSAVYGDFESDVLSFGLMGKKTMHELSNYINNNKIYDNINPFNGTMLSKDVVKKIGFPKKEFFISGDETEYSLRAKRNGCQLITIVNSEYFHPASKEVYKKFLWKKVHMRKSPLWRIYYINRNYSFINKTYYKNQFSYTFKTLIRAFIISDHRFLSTKYTLKGIIDGYRGKFINEMHEFDKYKKIC